MAIKDYLPTFGTKQSLPAERDEWSSPFTSLRREMNRIFDNFFSDFRLEPYGGGTGWSPRINIKETDKEVEISAELPGMDEKDIDLSISDDRIILRGEKKLEHEEKVDNFYRMECSYGSFHREIPLPSEVETDQVTAKFKKGVLTVHLPKKAEAQKYLKKISIKTA